MAGPPVNLMEMPWPYSCAMMPLSKSPSGTMPATASSETLTSAVSNTALSRSPSSRLIITAGITMLLSVPPIPKGSPATLLIMITAIAPRSCAFFTLTVKLQLPLSITAIFPARLSPLLMVPHASWVPPTASFTSTRSPVVSPRSSSLLAVLNADSTANISPAIEGGVLMVNGEFSETSDQTYICMRPLEPSTGVEKLALLLPPPSSASAFTKSLPIPPRPRLLF